MILHVCWYYLKFHPFLGKCATFLWKRNGSEPSRCARVEFALESRLFEKEGHYLGTLKHERGVERVRVQERHPPSHMAPAL